MQIIVYTSDGERHWIPNDDNDAFQRWMKRPDYWFSYDSADSVGVNVTIRRDSICSIRKLGNK